MDGLSTAETYGEVDSRCLTGLTASTSVVELASALRG